MSSDSLLRKGEGDKEEYSLFDRTLGKWMAFSGSSSGDYNSENLNIQKIIQERALILGTKINVAFLGWSRLKGIPKEAFDVSNSLNGVRFVLPPSKVCYHTSMWVADADDYCTTGTQGICIEYGTYSKGDSSHQNTVHYFKKDGLRFSRMSLRFYWESYVKGEEENFENFIPTKVENKMTVDELCENAFKKSPFNANDYSLFTHNCQFFTATCIKILGLKRHPYANSRGAHNESKTFIPCVVLLALEKEEKDGSALFGRIPLVGPFGEMLCYGYARRERDEGNQNTISLIEDDPEHNYNQESLDQYLQRYSVLPEQILLLDENDNNRSVRRTDVLDQHLRRKRRRR